MLNTYVCMYNRSLVESTFYSSSLTGFFVSIPSFYHFKDKRRYIRDEVNGME